ncbi:hypothetical protein Tco_0852815, partial [Tanacetum coccineum]
MEPIMGPRHKQKQTSQPTNDKSTKGEHMQSKGKQAKGPKGGTNPKEEPRLKEEPPTRKLRGAKPRERPQE